MNRPLVRLPLRTVSAIPVWKWLKWPLGIGILVILAIVAKLCQIEIETSRLQAHYLSELTRDIGFTVDHGPSPRIRFPAPAPYDSRLGYAQLPGFEQRLLARGYAVESQARGSERMLSIADAGLFLPYDEKDRAGLKLFDTTGTPLFASIYPRRAYPNFAAIPPVVVNALLFIEDRYLLDPNQPNRNPAIDWGRFSHALVDQGLRVFNAHQAQPGGSTLATQIEKFRHSPDGRTAKPTEKIRQIASASVRAYLNGPQTMPARRQIVVHYLNSVPLAARAHVGEVTGLGDGMAAWYGRDFDEINALLAAPTTADNAAMQGIAFRQALSLLIAQRAPSFFLLKGYGELQRMTDSYLRLLAGAGVISAPLRDAALAAHIALAPAPDADTVSSYVTRKAVTSMRARLMNVLAVPDAYALDRLDMSATSTLDNRVQQAVSEKLAAASTKDGAHAFGLYGFEMLKPNDDPSHIAFSFTLYEHRGGANLLRVQTDSVNEPFDINQGARLNLGSTAKLRTLTTYLQIVSELHDRYAPLSTAELKRIDPDPSDALTRWALDYLIETPDRALQPMLDAAVERKYSANPGETFYTGGGAQTFTNFDKSDNGQTLTIHVAFQNSVNLVFVRLMRDIVHYETIKAAGPSQTWLDDPIVRNTYLMQFVDAESQVYLKRFYEKYAGLASDDALELMLNTVRKSPPKIATVLRSVAPGEPQVWFNAQMRSQLKGTPAETTLSDEDLAGLYGKYGIDRFNLNDRAYISGVHPLALWLLNTLRAHPGMGYDALKNASRDVRVSTYSWLFKTRYHATQDRRIKRMIELQAYTTIGKSWQALGYPFSDLTPSYAAAIGASGDRPAALAELIGIIANDGQRAPIESFSKLDFAEHTPYETHFVHASVAPKTLLSPEIANVERTLLRDVVLDGTGKRLASGMVLPDGTVLPVYGKTGTGDQRFNVYAPGARLIESRKVNRSATFVFAIGDRFYGALSANAHEPYAARYDFTSAMAVQLLKSMAPDLQPLLNAPATDAAPAARVEQTNGEHHGS
ncbi:transglycosylase domain-containing protein [Pararobbsia silviterrae]|uniref:peptidoglycan glycosyltransferase n=1 Tax=Pararobbsia silviterrae TaxID=1792498 RepID=A0A494XS46_9BURK|nr:transglycosylase domain-containing protein [Pararobbsia silviterrae]RKP53458.1 glycosyl transferase family 51 [Pararobbsia silviterrae]